MPWTGDLFLSKSDQINAKLELFLMIHLNKLAEINDITINNDDLVQ